MRAPLGSVLGSRSGLGIGSDNACLPIGKAAHQWALGTPMHCVRADLLCLQPGGLFNFIVPYSYRAVYATVLCLLTFAALNRYEHTGRAGWLVAAAIACGFAQL